MNAAPMLCGRSPAAVSMLAELEYQKTVTAVLLLTTRPLDRNPKGPMFSQAEIEEMDRAMAMGLSAAGFAARLIARDKVGAAC